MENTKKLHLTLKKKWFDMIASGEKKEEYREMKHYWERRLSNYGYVKRSMMLIFNGEYSKDTFKKFDTITFKNGYSANAPTMIVEFKGIDVKGGKPDWGAEPGQQYFVIQLGEIISTSNYPRTS